MPDGPIEGQINPGNLESGARDFAGFAVKARHTDVALRQALARFTGQFVDSSLADVPRSTLRACRDRLQKALARERGKARCGHRHYDANRHITLHQALRALTGLLEGATSLKQE